MRSILYIMHVPWGIIKQRPHFIAEELSNLYHVDVLHRIQHFNKRQLVTKVEKKNSNISFYEYDILPFDKIPLLNCINTTFVNSGLLKRRIPRNKKYDAVWITSPYSYWYFKDVIPKNIPLYYDCMDDLSEFPELSKKRKNLIIKSEELLLKRVSHVFFSAEYLKDKIIQRYNYHGGYTIVNNAIEPPVKECNTILSDEINKKINFIKELKNPVIYIGTIAPWFDFESVISLLKANEDISVVLVGPASVEIPVHDRLYSIGTVPRESIFGIMKSAKVLIMPFKVNELIKSVNPVKLYEYIYSGKPVVASRYNESEKFLPFVSLYSNQLELQSIIGDLINSETSEISKEQRENFVLNTTWHSRVLQINEILSH